MKRTNAEHGGGMIKRESILRSGSSNRLGKEVRYCQRERVVTPFRLVMASALDAIESRKVETLADLQRGFNALFRGELGLQALHNQLSKRGFGEFMRASVERLVEKLVLNVLKIKEGHAFRNFGAL